MNRIATLAGFFSVAALTPAGALAQQVDSSRAGIASPARTVADTVGYPEVSPRRAFVTSLIVPGSMQIRFGRPKAAAIFLLAEAGTVGMSVKSWNDLRKAKDARKDTVGTPVLDAGGNQVIDPGTGQPRIDYAPRNPNLAGRIPARRAHLEDWIAAAVFNHIFAGADAYVAANLADFDANIETRGSERRVVARIRW